jgi:hypothetical protein
MRGCGSADGSAAKLVTRFPVVQIHVFYRARNQERTLGSGLAERSQPNPDEAVLSRFECSESNTKSAN